MKDEEQKRQRVLRGGIFLALFSALICLLQGVAMKNCFVHAKSAVMQDNFPGQIDSLNSEKNPDTENSSKNEKDSFGSQTPGGNHHEQEFETVWEYLFGENAPELTKEQGSYCVLIRKNGGNLVKVKEEQIYRTISVELETENEVTVDSVVRVCKNVYYVGEPTPEQIIIPEDKKNVPLVREPKTEVEDTVRDIQITQNNGKSTILMELNSVYEAKLSEDEEFIYLTLYRPFELYDKIIVLDAGHGGYDPGTSGGGVTEASVNLKVIRYLKELMDTREDIKVYYTRLDNSLPDLSARVEFANALHADFLLSVHCNYNDYTSIHGVDVMYSKLQVVDENFSSRILAEKCLYTVSREMGMTRRYLEERSSNLHLMKYCTMPCALVEIGFMSNPGDLEMLKTEKTQRACARALYKVIDECYRNREEKNE